MKAVCSVERAAWRGRAAESVERGALRTIRTAVALGLFSLGLAGPIGAAQTAAPQSAPFPKALKPYTSCGFPDMLEIVGVSPLAPGITARTVETAGGPQSVAMVAGERVMFAYLMTDYFANVKAELLPADEYPKLKKILIENLNYLDSQPNGPVKAEALPAGLHGFEVYGNDRTKLEGGVLGMYLLFDDPAHVATTIYFLNQHSWQRKFQTMDEYERLRDSFLRTYTGCVRQNQAIER